MRSLMKCLTFKEIITVLTQEYDNCFSFVLLVDTIESLKLSGLMDIPLPPIYRFALEFGILVILFKLLYKKQGDMNK